MLTRNLTAYDMKRYEEDIAQCYLENLQIMDSQSMLDISNRDTLFDYLFGLLEDDESNIEGIFDDSEKFLYGLIIYDGIRVTNDGNAAQLHLAVCRELWGRRIREILKEALNNTFFDVLYCMIPAFCRPTIALVKTLGFKKTGYIPKALPYVNLKGEEKMYDEYVFSWVKDRKGETEVPF